MTKKRKKKVPPKVRWFNRASATVLWLYALYTVTSLFDEFPPPEITAPVWEQQYRWLRYLVYVVIVVFVLRKYKWRGILYLASYPIWAPLKALAFLMKILMLGLVYIFKFFGVNFKILANSASPEFGAVCYVFVPICYLAIHDSQNAHVIYGASVLLVLLSYRIIYGVFKWAVKPLGRMGRIFKKLEAVYCIKGEDEIADIRRAAEKGERKKVENKLKSEHYFIRVLEWCEKHVLTQQRLLALFFVVMAFSVTLIVFNYGFAYWGLGQISHDHYSGQDAHRGLWDFIFYSSMVMTTSDLSEIVPLSQAARLLSATQIGCSIMLLSLIVLAFSTSGHADVITTEKSLKQLLTNRRDLYKKIKGYGEIEDVEVEEIDDCEEGEMRPDYGDECASGNSESRE